MTVNSSIRNTNWWGIAATIGLFAWFLCYFKHEPQTSPDRALFWGLVAMIHFFGIKAARRRRGWIYLVPLGVFWLGFLVTLLLDVG